MNPLTRPLRTIAALAFLLGIPTVGFAANKTWVSMTATPATTNITAGVAANLTSVIALRNGSGASARYVGPASLTISVSPADPNITASVNPTTLTYPNSDTTLSATVSVATTSLLLSNTYVVTITANTNPVSGSVTPTNCTFTISMATAPPFDPVKLWSAGVNGNWSTAGNWTPGGAPTSVNDVRFSDTGVVGTSATVNNTVDASFTIGSLTYGQTNNYHTTLISPGLTLALTGTNGLNAGTGTAAGDGIQTVTTVQGAGAALLVNNPNAIINVDQSQPISGLANSTTMATLDLSGLDTFTANVSRVLVGVDTAATLRGACGVLNLAQTNRITVVPGSAAPQIDIGDNTQTGTSPGLPSILLLGRTNAIFADSIAVGRGKSASSGGSSMLFNSSFANPTVFLRGTNGDSSRVGLWTIGDAWGAKSSQNSGTIDFTLGNVDALVNQMFVGRGASVAIANGANVAGVGTLSIGAGRFDVNSLEVGYGIDAAGAGTININGGALVANSNFELAHGVGSIGIVTVSSGTLTANPGIIAGGGSATLALSSGTLNATNATASIGTLTAPLTLLALTNSTMTLAAQSEQPEVVATTFSPGGTANTLNFSSVPVITALPAQFQVLQYTTADGDLASLALGSLPSASPAYAGYLSNNTANSTVDLVLTAGPVVAPLVWKGQINGDWDTTTANWKTNGVSTTYPQGYRIVRFDDTLTGTSLINLTTTLTPGSVTVDNSAADYTFTGTGKLSGNASLTKSGTRTLTLTESGGDNFTGGVTISGGTLQIGNSGTSGNLPAGRASVEDGASLVFNRSDNVLVPTVISGLGTLVQNGASILALTASNSTFAGQIVIAHGTLQAGNAASLGTATAAVTVSNTATLDVNGQQFNNAKPVIVSGAGINSNGAIVNNNTNQTKVLRNVTLTGNATFGGYADWDIHSSANGASDAILSTSGSGFKLTKSGTNTVTLFGVQVDDALGDIDILAGTLSFERNSTSMGDLSRAVTVFTNATLQFQNASNVWSKFVVLKDGATFRAINRDEFAGAVSLESGVGTMLVGTGGQLLQDGAVNGAGGLTKTGGGTVTLAGANTYLGPTVVSAGTLALGPTASIANSSSITIAAGSVVDVSALGDQTLAVATGHSLQGSGTVVGNVTMGNGSTLVTGVTGTNGFGTLTVTNELTLQAGSAIQMKVGKAGTNVVNDQVAATNVTYGGTLTVTGGGGAFAAGDSFKLFSAASYSGAFSSINLPVGTTWDTSKLTVDGSIKVMSVVRPQFSGIAQTNGGFQLSFSGPAGNNYRVWASTNIAATPIANTWSLLVSNGLFAGSGTASFFDAGASNYPARFYLISVP